MPAETDSELATKPVDSGRGYALFDLDHTLLPHDTQVLFCNFVLRREGWRRVYLLWFLPLLPLAAPKVLGLRQMKRAFCSYLWRMPLAKLREYARDFAREVLEKHAYPEVVAELNRHRDAGRVTILNTASPSFYAKALAEAFGFDHCVCTPVTEMDPMPLFPEITGPNNKHEAKIARMAPLLPAGFDAARGDVLPDSTGYSDSSADVPLLSVCEHGVQIHPSERFAAIGRERGWRVLTPPRPYVGKWGDRLSAFRQALGVYR